MMNGITTGGGRRPQQLSEYVLRAVNIILYPEYGIHRSVIRYVEIDFEFFPVPNTGIRIDSACLSV